MSSQFEVARATAGVFVNGVRAGSAVLVDNRHLLTSAHVLVTRKTSSGTESPTSQLEVEFPSRKTGEVTERISAVRVTLDPSSEKLDIAVLDLGDAEHADLPAAVRASALGRLPREVKVFGYPLGEGVLAGVWRDFAVAGPTGGAFVQLDWSDGSGTFPGHSGSPVIDNFDNSLVGILVEGSIKGQFDRYLPVTLIEEIWPTLPRGWLIVGAGQAGARDHFRRRALGQRSIARGGDLFRGRRAALSHIYEWLTGPEPRGLPLVIVGQPGAGKSAVLARAMLALEAEGEFRGVAFHARAATIEDFIIAVSDLVGIDTPSSPDELIGAVSILTRTGRQLLLVVDALDEAASELDRRKITESLAELAVLSGLRIAIATRALSSGRRYAQGGILPALGIRGSNSINLIDLDNDKYFEAGDLEDFAAALLSQESADHPGPPGAAWEGYRSNAKIRRQLGAVIAGRADRNFLVAAMAALPLSIERHLIDVEAEGFDPDVIPSGVGEGLDKYLDRLPEGRKISERGILTALAYGRGDGLDDQRWISFAEGLGYSANIADIDVLRNSPAADFLLQTIPSTAGGRQLTRLFHQALADELLALRHRPGDEELLIDVLMRQAEEGSGWGDGYLQRYAADHAASAGRLDQLLEKKGYLLDADPTSLTPLLDKANAKSSRTIVSVYKQAAHLLVDLDPRGRASQLEFHAYRLGYPELAQRFAQMAPDRPWKTLWSTIRADSDHQTFSFGMNVSVLEIFELPDATPGVIMGGYSGSFGMRRLSDGSHLEFPAAHPSTDIVSLAVGSLPGGVRILAIGDLFGVTLRRLSDGKILREINVSANGLAFGSLPDGKPVLIVSSTVGIGIWNVISGAKISTLLDKYRGKIYDVATGTLPDGTMAVATGGADGLRVWRLADGRPLRTTKNAYNKPVRAIKILKILNNDEIIISAANSGEICVSNLTDGRILARYDSGHDGAISAIDATVTPDGKPVVVSGGRDGIVRARHLFSGATFGSPLIGHIGPVQAVKITSLARDKSVVVTSGSDGTVRVWPLAADLSEDAGIAQPSVDDTFTRVALGVNSGHVPVVVSAGHKGIRAWQAADGTLLDLNIDFGANAVAIGDLQPDGAVVIGESFDSVGVWRMGDGGLVSETNLDPRDEYDVEAVAIINFSTGKLPVGVVCDYERISRLNFAKGSFSRTFIAESPFGVARLCGGVFADDVPFVVVAGGDGMIQVLRVEDGEIIGEWDCGEEYIVSMSVGVLADGARVLVVATEDNALQAFLLPDGEFLWEFSTGQRLSVSALAAGVLPNGTPVVIGGCEDGAMQAWTLADGLEIGSRLQLPGLVHDVTMLNGLIAAAGTDAVSVHSLD